MECLLECNINVTCITLCTYLLYSLNLFCNPPPSGLDLDLDHVNVLHPDRRRNPCPTTHLVASALTSGSSIPPVPPNLVQKIESGEFIELGYLVPNHLGFEETVGSKSKQCPITNISEWLQVFAVYVSVIARKQPQRVPDLMGYQILMLEASNEYQNNCWLAYDRRFRKQAASQPNCKWSNIDSTFWNLAFTIGIASVYSTNQKTASSAQAQPPTGQTHHDKCHFADGTFADIGTSNIAKDAPSQTVVMNMYAIIVHIIQQPMM